MLTDEEGARIAEAVTRAEATTSGEVVCILAREVSRYREVPLAAGAAAALLLPPLALVAGLDPLALTRAMGGWTAAHAGALRSALALTLGGYALAQVLLFALVVLIASLPLVRRRLTPRGLRRHRVRQVALAQLAAAVRASGPDRAAVVIFASIDDRMVEVLASAAIDGQAGGEPWSQAVDAVLAGIRNRAPADGFVKAVEICGAALARHFPAQGADPNALPDAPVEI